MTPNPPSSEYANARRLVAQTLAAYLPPDRISIADYAAEHRYLANEGGGYVGRWSHEKAPYLVGVMDALDDPDHTTIALVKPGQCGGTAIAENWLLRLACNDPADLLWYMQTEPSLQAYVKQTINPMIASHADLAARLGSKRTDDSLSYKGFLGMSVQFLAATQNNLTNKRAGRIIADEYDAYDGLSADPKSLLDVRRSTYGRESKLFCLSHPDRAAGSTPKDWTAGILALYRDSDRRTWWWACPHCEMWSSPNPGTRHHMTLEYTDTLPIEDVAASAHLLCPHNGCIVADSDRRRMNLTGRWIGIGQHIDEADGTVTGELAQRDTAGFWIVGVMSPFVFGGLGGLATAIVKAQREYEQTGDDGSLRQVVVKQVGTGYDSPRQVGSINAETIAERADPALALGTVPDGVRFIACAIDVQANRFELLYRGFGLARESWVIAHQIVPRVEPATDPDAWDRVLTAAMDCTFPLADGSGRVMAVRGVGYDSAGQAGVTIQAMDAWRRFKKVGRARSIGMIGSRPGYTLLPLKGGSVRAANPTPLQIIRPDARADRHSTARGDVPVGLFAPNWHKDVLAAQLERAVPGPGHVHFPAGLLNQVGGAPRPPHPFFEQLCAERRLKNGQWEKTAPRNEALDLMVMTGVVAHLFAPSRFDWARPPPWARDWDHNPLVTMGATKIIVPSVAKPVAIAPVALPAGLPPPARAGGSRLSLRQLLGQARP